MLRKKMWDPDCMVPWFNQDLREARLQLRHLEHQWRCNYDPISELSNRADLKNYKQAVLQTKAAFYNGQISSMVNIQMETFKVLEELSHAKTLTKAPLYSQEDCNTLHAFFIRKIELIRKHILSSAPFTRPPDLTLRSPPL